MDLIECAPIAARSLSIILYMHIICERLTVYLINLLLLELVVLYCFYNVSISIEFHMIGV